MKPNPRFSFGTLELMLHQRSTLISTIPISCLVVSLGIFGWFQVKTAESEQWVQHTQNVQLEGKRLMTGLLDAETGVRGYDLTNRPPFLEPYNNSLTAIPRSLVQLRRYVADNPGQLEQLKRVEVATTKVLELLQKNLIFAQSFPSNNTSASLSELLIEGKLAMDATRQEMEKFLAEEDRLLVQRKQRLEQERQLTWFVLILAAGLGIIGSLAALFLLRHQEARTRANEQRFRDTFEQAAVGIAHVSLQGGFQRLNQRFCEIVGYSNAELSQLTFQEITHPEDLHQDESLYRQLLANEIPSYSLEKRYIRKDGSLIWVNLTVSLASEQGPDSRLPSSHENGQADLYALAVIEDISDRKQVETKLERERQLLRQIITNAPVAMAMFDRDMTYIAYSDKWLSDLGLVGTEPAFLVGQNHYNIFPAMPEEWKEAHQRALQGEIVLNPEDIFLHADGSKSYLRWAIHPWYEPNGEVGGIVLAVDKIDELVRAREAALENSRMKSQFLANMSHEIRTPMNGVLGMAGLLLKTELSQKQLDFVQAIRTSADHLLAIINDILDFSKLEAGEMLLESIEFDLNGCLDTVVDLLATQAADKGLELAVIIDPSVSRHLQGDPGRLRQVLLNLMGNAIKFTSLGEVVVRVTHESGTPKTDLLRFTVSDTGIGISPEGQQRLFQAFSQVDASTTRQYGGTGLGLVISRQLVNLMGGEIGVESKLGEGSTFWFTARFVKPESERKSLLPPTLMDLTLLVVDTSATVRQAVRYLAQSWGMQIEEAQTGEVALRKLRFAAAQGQPYDAAIFDQQLLQHNGDNLADLIRSDVTLAPTKLILMTSINQRDLAEQFIQLGVSSYLIKPVRASRLFDALLTAMANRIASVLEGSRESLTLPSSELLTSPLANLQILLAEDHPINQQVILNQLALLGYQADLANNGREVLEKASQKRYDLVFMDCQMPLLDGYGATQALREREVKNQNQPGHFPHRVVIIALTAHAMPADREKCLAAGMDDYLSKPVDQEELQAVIGRWLEKIRPEMHQEVDPGERTLSSPASMPLSSNFSTVSPLNLDRLNAVCGGSAEFQKKLLQAFSDRAQVDLEEMKRAIERSDCSELTQQAHRFKGASANVGALELSALAAQLESRARQETPTELAKLVSAIEQQLEEVKRFILRLSQ